MTIKKISIVNCSKAVKILNASVFPSVNFLFVLEFFQTTTITDSVMATDYSATLRTFPFFLFTFQKFG